MKTSMQEKKPTYDKKVFFDLLSDCNSTVQIQSVVGLLDSIWRDDRVSIEVDDWSKLSKLIGEVKGRIDSAQ